MGDIEWSPIYGKVAFLNDILHFDAYLLGGAGVVNTEAASVVINEATNERRGLVPGLDLGLGARFVARDFLAVNLSLINTTYVDQPAGTSKGATQNLMTLNLGISVFFPFTSTGREAE
jgi:outer membrane beta-barrel protein